MFTLENVMKHIKLSVDVVYFLEIGSLLDGSVIGVDRNVARCQAETDHQSATFAQKHP